MFLALIFWAIISGYQLPVIARLDFSSLLSWLHPAPGTIPFGSIGSIYKNSSQVTNASLHGLDGHEGIDISGGCDTVIYSPIAGTVTYNGLDGYNHVDGDGKIWPQSTMLVIAGDGIEFEVLHGDYAPAVGTKVWAGQAVGKENKHGWATGCHSHVVMRKNGRIVNYLTWLQEETSKRRLVKRGGELATYGLRLSHYWPAYGGINGDADPTTMASGQKVADWIGGQNGTYAAACPQNWGWKLGDRFTVYRVDFECTDHGGYINCYSPGEIDKAIANAHRSGHLLDIPEVVEEPVCWIDALMQTPIAPFGTMTYDWSKQ